ncbi:MAG: hypothetical protein VX311_03580, partial [Planctomycetota bacterium]|nr:hypothetical protein [Planctomycetota bacterium]
MINPRISLRWPTATLVATLVLTVGWIVFVSGSTRSVQAQAQAKKPAAKAATADILTETDIIRRVTDSLDR